MYTNQTIFKLGSLSDGNRSGLGTDYEKASAIVTNQGGVPAMQQLLHGRLVFQRSLVAAMLQMF